MLDLTPNYEGVSAWFNSAAAVAERLKVSADKKGVDLLMREKATRGIKRLSREADNTTVQKSGVTIYQCQ